MTYRPNSRSRRTRTEDAPEPPIYEWLPRPLNGHLATIDPHNARIKLFRETPDVLEKPEALEVLRRRFDEREAFSKLMVYATEEAPERWSELGFEREGRIGRFFRDGADAVLWAKYSDEDRAVSETRDEEEEVIRIALSKEPVEDPILPGEFTPRIAKPGDADMISSLLRQTFSEYPVDVSPETIRPMIARHKMIFQLAEIDEKIVALAAAEIDVGWRNVEILNCVTVEEHRRRGIMVSILDRLVRHVALYTGIKDFYSLARSREVGINAALARAGFTYDGRLVNNCRMPSGWETMNVWWRTAGGSA